MPTDEAPGTPPPARSRAAARWTEESRGGLAAAALCLVGVAIVLTATSLGISPLGGVLGPATAEPPSELARGAAVVEEVVTDEPSAITPEAPGLGASPVAPSTAAPVPGGQELHRSGPGGGASPGGAGSAGEPAADSTEPPAVDPSVPLTELVLEPAAEEVVEPAVEQVVEPATEHVVQPVVQATLALLDPVLSAVSGATDDGSDLLGGLLGAG